ncbi:MAG: class I SAM-dependent methyltransferase [Sphingomonas bacterium]|nr:class I SAM-dependent methyltransferase [Sphingomonas bacterium]
MTSARDWSGKVGEVWASEWRRTDRSFADLSRRLDAAILDAAPHQGVALDIGCGAGATSIALARLRPDIDIVGADIADELVAIARQRSGDMPNLRFVIGDLDRGMVDMAAPDLIVSRHGVMFFSDPTAAFARLLDTAAPGVRLVFSCFRDASDNPWASDLVAEVTGVAASRPRGYAPGPFGFADCDFVGGMLRGAGWRDAAAEAVDYRYVAGAGDDPVADAVDFFRRIGPIASVLREIPKEGRAAILDKLAAALHKRVEQGEVAFPASAWIWRASGQGRRP